MAVSFFFSIDVIWPPPRAGGILLEGGWLYLTKRHAYECDKNQINFDLQSNKSISADANIRIYSKMPSFSLDTWLGITGPIGFVISTALSIYFYIKSCNTKSLCIASAGPISLIKRFKNTPNIDIYYDGTQINGVYRSYILFWNTGWHPISSDDFHVQTQISDPNKNIMTSEISHIDVGSEVNLMSNRDGTLEMDIKLLRENEAFIITIDASSKKYRGTVQARSKSSKLIRGFPDAKHFIIRVLTFMFVISGFIIGGGIAIMIAKYSGSYMDDKSLFIKNLVGTILGIFFLIIFPIVIGVYSFQFLNRMLGHGNSKIVDKFLEIQNPRIFDDHLYETET